MKDRRCFVQFIHPGGEHQPDHDGCKDWNLGDHKRKFLKTPGRYRYRATGPDMDGEIVFWGEWEPESCVVAQFANLVNHDPRFVYRPFFVKPNTNARRQNTDPFVFGDQFHYTGCLQHTVNGATQLRHLSPGSIILFGSCIESKFVLDTAFVVADHVDHSLLNYGQVLAKRISKTYQFVTIDPWYSRPPPPPGGQSHRLYFGATPNTPVDGMFSFFPCEPLEEGSSGFARPQIAIQGRVTQTLRQGKKISFDLTAAQVKQLWDDVVAQVIAEGLALGTYAELPPSHKAAMAQADGTRSARSGRPKNKAGRRC